MDENPSYCVPQFPTEILLLIFTYLPAIKLLQCRRVCTRWKDIIDSMLDESSWLQYCMQDYKHMFNTIKHRIQSGISYFALYKTFSLWPMISQARVVQEEFALARRISQEIRGFVLLSDNLIGVRKNTGIAYHNQKTFTKCRGKRNVMGTILGHAENRDVMVLHKKGFVLQINMKAINNKEHPSSITISSVTHYLLTDKEIYYVQKNCELYVYNYHESTDCTYIGRIVDDYIYCLGCKDDILYLSTINRSIYKVQGGHVTLECSLNNSPNLMHTLNLYNLLEHFYFNSYTELMYNMNQQIPKGPLEDMLVIRIYGDIVFVGTKWGVFRVYYKPYIGGVFDIYNSEPVKEFNFMESGSCRVLFYSQIICIDVAEGANEHIVFVGMPNKIAVIKFIHDVHKTSTITSSVVNLTFNSSSAIMSCD